MKKLHNVKFKTNNSTESCIIQKLLFKLGVRWNSGSQYIKHNHSRHLVVDNGKLFESLIDCDLKKKMTISELQEFVGSHLYHDILGCVVDTPMGVDYVKSVYIMSDNTIVLVLGDGDVVSLFNTYGVVDDNVRFFTNDENDDTLPFDEFLKFIRG